MSIKQYPVSLIVILLTKFIFKTDRVHMVLNMKNDIKRIVYLSKKKIMYLMAKHDYNLETVEKKTNAKTPPI